MSALEYLLLAFASAFWPLLFAVVLVALRTARPLVPLTSFLAGALLACISIGLLLVFSLDDTSLIEQHRSVVDPVVNITAGVLALAGAGYVLRRPRPQAQRSERRRWAPEQFVENPKLAFVAGVVLDLLPGVFPFVALKNIAEGSYSAAANVALVVVFYLIMFTPVELPILGYVVMPDRTVATVQRFNDWLDRDARRIGAGVLAVVGVYLIARGLLQL